MSPVRDGPVTSTRCAGRSVVADGAARRPYRPRCRLHRAHTGEHGAAGWWRGRRPGRRRRPTTSRWRRSPAIAPRHPQIGGRGGLLLGRSSPHALPFELGSYGGDGRLGGHDGRSHVVGPDDRLDRVANRADVHPRRRPARPQPERRGTARCGRRARCHRAPVPEPPELDRAGPEDGAAPGPLTVPADLRCGPGTRPGRRSRVPQTSPACHLSVNVRPVTSGRDRPSAHRRTPGSRASSGLRRPRREAAFGRRPKAERH